jgi:predicted DCC family thiol-disulfide oxidoreductase YuxK
MTVQVVRFTIAGQDALPAGAIVVGPPAGYRWTVVYDGFCRVCRKLARSLASLDTQHKFEIVPSQHPGVRARFPWIPPRAYDASLQLVRRDGRTWQGAAAIEQIVRDLPKGRIVSWLFDIPFARGIADRFYRWFARHRRQLGCGSHCAYRPEDIDFPP